MNVGDGGLGVRNTFVDVGDNYIGVYQKLSLGTGNQ